MTADNNLPSPRNLIILGSISTLFSWILLQYHLLFRHDVVCFEISKSHETSKAVASALRSGRLKKISWTDLSYSDRAGLDNEVLEITEHLFSRYYSGSGQIRMLRTLVGSPEIDFAFKKILGKHVHAILRFLLQAESVKNASPHASLHLYPSVDFSYPLFCLIRDSYPQRYQGFSVPASCRLILGIHALIERGTWFLISLAFPGYIAGKILYSKYYQSTRNPYGPLGSQTYKLGIRIYDNDIGFYQDHKAIDFLLKQQKITPDQVVFCIETGMHDHYRDELIKRHYNVIEIPRCYYLVTLSNALGYGKKIPGWIASVVYSVTEPPWITAMAVESRNTVFLWTAFLNRYSLDHYICYNDVLPKHVPRNLVLRDHKILSWYYVHSCNTTNYFTPPGREPFKNLYFSFLCYDRFVTWSDKIRDYYAMHPNGIKKFENTGCLWSEHTREFRDHGISDENLKQWILHQKEKNANIRFIGVFDTTSGPEYPLQSDDINLFISDICRLAEKNPDIALIFKTKLFTPFSMADNPRLKGLSLDKYQRIESATEKSYDLLHEHPRIFLMSEIHSEPSEVISVSDLVISACFSSPSIEAMGGHTKAMFFDACDRFSGYYYDKFPCMVAHSTEDLEKYVRFWLNELSDDEFEQYVQKWVIPEIDAFADGRAISRFISLLEGGKPAETE